MVIYHIRDIKAIESNEMNNVKQYVSLRCLIVRRRKLKETLFIDVQDESDSTQIAVQREPITAAQWVEATSLRTGDAVTVEGYLTNIYPGANIIVDRIARVAEEMLNLVPGRQHTGVASPIAAAYITRLKKFIREKFEKDNFIEIDTRMISSLPPPKDGMHPLKVVYDGYGAPFYIAPSPAPQLIQTISMTPYDRVFCMSRCFTQGYRDPVVSVESAIVMGIERKRSLSSFLLFADTIVRELLTHPETRTKLVPKLPVTKTERYMELKEGVSASVSQPEVQIFQMNSDKKQTIHAGRLCWPWDKRDASEFREYVVAEGYSSGMQDNPAFSVISINIDRLLALLLEKIDLRRIPSLQL